LGEGLSIVTNVLANQVQFNLDSTQSGLSTLTNQLSSGLRINSAADDPSGLAIADDLQTSTDAFTQSIQNVQTANNASQVALGAYTTTTDILMRIRSLAVEAASDISSDSDRQNLQAEVQQLLLEINRISQNVSFNGNQLLDGSHAGYQSGQNAFGIITANAALSSSVPPVWGSNGVNLGFLVASVAAANANFNTTVGIAGWDPAGGTYATVDGSIELTVVNTGVSIAVQETFINSATGQISVSPELLGPQSAGTIFENTTITLGSFTTLDVGVTSFLKISQNVASSSNPTSPAFSIQAGSEEGDTIQIGIQACNTATLRISNINLAISFGNNPSLGAQDAIGQVDLALQTLLQQQSMLGALVVRLNDDANNESISAVNTQAAESAIRDLNVGQATTQFTQKQILVQIGTSVLAQANYNADTVLTLFR
jgi:flagellin